MLPVHRKYSKHYSSRQSFLASKMWGSDDEASIDKPAGMPAGPDTNATSNIEPPAREGRAVVPDLPPIIVTVAFAIADCGRVVGQACHEVVFFVAFPLQRYPLAELSSLSRNGSYLSTEQKVPASLE